MHKVLFGIITAMLATTVMAVAQQEATIVQVFKSPTCGCCSKWVEHLNANGFATRVTNLDDLRNLKARDGVPSRLQSCHTAIVEGYVIEGHVPAADMRRLLKERPSIAGLAVPGMPTGSPGMEVAGAKVQPYEVIAFDKQGNTRVFVSHGR